MAVQNRHQGKGLQVCLATALLLPPSPGGGAGRKLCAAPPCRDGSWAALPVPAGQCCAGSGAGERADAQCGPRGAGRLLYGPDLRGQRGSVWESAVTWGQKIDLFSSFPREFRRVRRVPMLLYVLHSSLEVAGRGISGSTGEVNLACLSGSLVNSASGQAKV